MPAQAAGGKQDKQVESFVNAAREHLASIGSHIKDLADSNGSLTQPTGTEYTFKGQIGIRSAIFVTKVDGYAFVAGTRINFSGHACGPALNIGEFVGGGTFGYLSPQEVLGHCTFEVHGVGVGPGMVQVTWIRGSQILGTFLGGGPNIGVTLPSGGSGTWSSAIEG